MRDILIRNGLMFDRDDVDSSSKIAMGQHIKSAQLTVRKTCLEGVCASEPSMTGGGGTNDYTITIYLTFPPRITFSMH